MDRKWWDTHIAEIRRDFRGDLTTTSNEVKHLGLKPMGTYGRGFQPYGNSGAGAMALAGLAGARRIVMLGYDCQRTGGMAHWHGDHPKGLGNAGSMPKWPGQFEKCKAGLAGVEIINCSRDTALAMFPRASLHDTLGA